MPTLLCDNLQISGDHLRETGFGVFFGLGQVALQQAFRQRAAGAPGPFDLFSSAPLANTTRVRSRPFPPWAVPTGCIPEGGRECTHQSTFDRTRRAGSTAGPIRTLTGSVRKATFHGSIGMERA